MLSTYPRQHDGAIRWKMLEARHGGLSSICWNVQWHGGKLKVKAATLFDCISRPPLPPFQHLGIHVSADGDPAYLHESRQGWQENATGPWKTDRRVVCVKLRCSSFVGGGVAEYCSDADNGHAFELWREAQVLEVDGVPYDEWVKPFMVAAM